MQQKFVRNDFEVFDKTFAKFDLHYLPSKTAKTSSRETVSVIIPFSIAREKAKSSIASSIISCIKSRRVSRTSIKAVFTTSFSFSSSIAVIIMFLLFPFPDERPNLLRANGCFRNDFAVFID
ncbi:MAG: hypothetical protein LH472_07095 [Pyrinomonadaceae bacterium]|nr:hypothetical protein [Pyrinomonadaceae bacterium]